MQLFDNQLGPNPRRVRIFLAEKGIPCPPRTDIDIMVEQQKAGALGAKNPWHRIPFLELDDGTVISESLAICRYFEEVQPLPACSARGLSARRRWKCGTAGSSLVCCNSLQPFSATHIHAWPNSKCRRSRTGQKRRVTS